jgi:beta-galactosidase
VEAVRRGPALFLLNHGDRPAAVPLPAPAADLLTGARHDRAVDLPARTGAVLVDPSEGERSR